ncbi:TRAP transporter permease, partial [Brevirhabdus pacifica]
MSGSAAPPSSRPLTALVADGLSTLLVLVAIAWSLNLTRKLGFHFYAQQYLALLLGLSLAITFLSSRSCEARPTRAAPWGDQLLAALSLLVLGFVALRYPALVLQVFLKPLAVWVPGLLTTALLLEALRRITGWALPAIVTVFLFLALAGNMLPWDLDLRVQEFRLLSGYMGFDANAVLGLPLAVAGGVIVVFLLLGALLGLTGGTRFFTDLSIALMGRFRGGSMKIAVLSSALFGTVSGSAVANVLSTGTVTIPLIKDDGFSPPKAAGIEAAASTGGQLLPPVMGAAAFLMAEFLEVTYAAVAYAALLPALLFYAALFIQADFEAARLNLRPMHSSRRPPLRRLWGGWHFPLTFAVLIFLLFGRGFQAERAGLWAAATLIVTGMIFGYGGQRPGLRALVQGFAITGRRASEIAVIAAGAGVVIGVLGITGLGFNLTYVLVALGGGNPVVLLLLAALICIVLGMGLPTLAVYVLLAALVAPALVETGVPPMAAHLYVLYFGMMSMITP